MRRCASAAAFRMSKMPLTRFLVELSVNLFHLVTRFNKLWRICERHHQSFMWSMLHIKGVPFLAITEWKKRNIFIYHCKIKHRHTFARSRKVIYASVIDEMAALCRSAVYLLCVCYCACLLNLANVSCVCC